MSFNDLERGSYAAVAGRNTAAANGALSTQSQEETTYKRTVQELSRKVFQINASVANIRQLVGQLGTTRDTSRLRQDIHTKMEDTRDLVKTTTTELKGLSDFQSSAATAAARRARKLEQQKLTADFQKVLEQFQSIQRVSAEATREFVDRAKHAVQTQQGGLSPQHMYDEFGENSPLLGNNRQRQQQQLQQSRHVELSILDNDIEYNEALINERETEIADIEQGIVELNEIFRDLGTIVTEQQSLLDNIERNVDDVVVNVQEASNELTSADRHDRRASKTKWCLMLFAMLFFIIVLLIALS
ncbi:hypothetical protein GGI07_002473 [Coemansia sp. Benny D115]|nr:hypothetical protein GGI07_002473 [Coemansia sp. Benny D115]